MTPKFLEAFIQLRIKEVLDECCNEQDAFYAEFKTFYDETRYVDTLVAEAVLYFEEKMNENLSIIEKVYRTAFEDGYRASELKQPHSA